MKLIVALLVLIGTALSLTPQEEKQLIRDIAEIKASLKVFMEQVDKRFEQINNELDRLVNIIAGVFAGQIALVAGVIGFAQKELAEILKREGLL